VGCHDKTGSGFRAAAAAARDSRPNRDLSLCAGKGPLHRQKLTRISSFAMQQPPNARAAIARERRSHDASPARVGSQTDDETLAAEALAGKPWAQREVWHRYASMVYGLLRGSLNSRHDHDDLVQEVFLRVFRRLHTLENPSALRSFVYSVAIRVLSEEIRHFYVLQRARHNLLLVADTRESRGTDFESRDILLRIQRILDGLKDKHRAVFVLRHMEGMDLREIATGLDISLATVKRYLLKAMRTIEDAATRDEGLRFSLAGIRQSETRRGAPCANL
jgi:RNA polymerase sigma-70 factor (ECF subfamily)